jgi:hypothetical protein
VAAIAALVLVAACARSDTTTYDPDRSVRSLREVGWVVSRVATPPETLGGGRQLAYLEATAPDRRRIDLQFLARAGAATEELAARRRRMSGFGGTTIGNVLVIPGDPAEESPRPTSLCCRAGSGGSRGRRPRLGRQAQHPFGKHRADDLGGAALDGERLRP